MLKKHNMLSVNQLNAQIKLTEIWKAINIWNVSNTYYVILGVILEVIRGYIGGGHKFGVILGVGATLPQSK